MLTCVLLLAKANYVEGLARVRHLPGFAGPAGWVRPLVQVVVEADSVQLR
jgi:hypothetical protein